MKVLIWAGVIAAVVLWVMSSRRASRRDAASARNAEARSTESMQACAHCGVYLPSSECLDGEAGRVYCSEEHRRLAGGS